MALARVRIALTAGIALLALLAACAAPVKLQNTFDPAEAAYAIKPGTGTVEGEAFVRKPNGHVATAAGLEIDLFPVTPVTTEIMSAVHTGATLGQLPPELGNYVRVVRADAKGRFKFEQVSAGEYYVFTRVDWTERRGGGESVTFGKRIYAHVTLGPGEHKKVLLAGQQDP